MARANILILVSIWLSDMFTMSRLTGMLLLNFPITFSSSLLKFSGGMFSLKVVLQTFRQKSAMTRISSFSLSAAFSSTLAGTDLREFMMLGGRFELLSRICPSSRGVRPKTFLKASSSLSLSAVDLASR